jgi:hypothetical protein
VKIFKRRRRANQVQVAGDNSIQIQSAGSTANVVVSARNGSVAAWNINGSVSITPEGITIGEYGEVGTYCDRGPCCLGQNHPGRCTLGN